MTTMRPNHLLVALCALWQPLLRPAPASGQWSVGLEVGADRYWGSSVDVGGEHQSFRPYRPTSLGVGLEKRGGRLGVALHLHYSGASLALEAPDVLVAAKGIFTVFHASPELIYRVATFVGTNQLRLHAGPVFEVWGIDGADTQVRVGGQAGLSLRLPLGGRFAGLVLANVALTGSPLPSDEIVEGFERRALWRRSVGGALQFQL